MPTKKPNMEGVAMGYTREEMETTCVYDYLTKTWIVYTRVPTHITKLTKIADPVWTETEPDVHGKPRIIAGNWELAKSQVRFAKLTERPEENEDEENGITAAENF